MRSPCIPVKPFWDSDESGLKAISYLDLERKYTTVNYHAHRVGAQLWMPCFRMDSHKQDAEGGPAAA